MVTWTPGGLGAVAMEKSPSLDGEGARHNDSSSSDEDLEGCRDTETSGYTHWVFVEWKSYRCFDNHMFRRRHVLMLVFMFCGT